MVCIEVVAPFDCHGTCDVAIIGRFFVGLLLLARRLHL